MAEKQQNERWPKKPIPISDIDDMWKKLLFYGQEYASLCAALRKAGKESVLVTGKDSADGGLVKIKSWLRTLRNVADEIQIDAQKAADLTLKEALEIEREFKATGTTTGTPKKKK
jgi:hypothetical protein